MSDNIFDELNKDKEEPKEYIKEEKNDLEDLASVENDSLEQENSNRTDLDANNHSGKFDFDMNQQSEYSHPNMYGEYRKSENPYQQYYSTPADRAFENPYSQNNSYQVYNNPYAQLHVENKKEKVIKAKMPKGAIAILIVVCIVLSAAFGFGGTLLANQISGNSGNSPMIVHEVVPKEEKSSTTTVDKSDAQITKEVADSVVEITTEVMTTNSFYGQYTTQGAGSGVIVSSEGNESYIVTNNHVIENASKISVATRDGKNYDATLIGTDSKLDIALIKIKASGLKCAAFGDSSKISVGDKAVAIGNPLGSLGGSVTSGIISALDRNIEIDGEVHSLMQTDAAINPGNSGGGLFNGQGELIGIVVAKSTGEAVECLGFAIPSNDVKSILSDLKQYGYVTGRGDIGFEAVDVSNNLYAMYQFRSQEPGVYVSSVSSGSAAATAGVQPGYRVISVNGKEIADTSALNEAVRDLKAGDEVKFVFANGDKKVNISYKLDEYKPIANSNKQQQNQYNGQDDFDMFDFFGY